MNDKQISFQDTSIAFADKSDKELRRMNILFALMGTHELTKVGIFFIKTAFVLKIPIKKIIKKTLFKQFCGGETLQECDIVAKKLYNSGIQSIPDYSIEGASDENSFDDSMQMVLKTIEMAKNNKAIGFCVFKCSGIASSLLLEKVQKKKALTASEENDYKRFQERIDAICGKAFSENIKILVDAEESWIQEVIDFHVLEMMEKYNGKKNVVYNTYQMYKKNSMADLKLAFDFAREKQFHLAVKLVRGAYMEKEKSRAAKENYSSPIHITKADTDSSYHEGLMFCVKNKIALCAGSHNEESNKRLMDLMKENNIKNDDPLIYFAQLFGMSDPISYNLSAAGYCVAKYLPFGPVESVMPYLFRRAEENKSVTGQTSRELRLVRAEMKRRKKQ